MSKCPLCQRSDELSPLSGPDRRAYLLCNFCKLIHSEASYKLTPEEEKERYLLHNNTPKEPGYVQFLSRSLEQARKYTFKPESVLDYGCGPSPVLANLATDVFGVAVQYYDPYFFPNDAALSDAYDLVFSTEVFEHFENTAEEITKVLDLVKKGGLLCIMTELYTDINRFKTWYYARDPTHISFFHNMTIAYVCKNWGLTCLESTDSRVLVLRKND
jgi:SAM-dependent methyltransferase